MRKRILTTLALLAAPLAFASIVVLFNPTTKQLVQIIPSADTLQYIGRADALINPVIPTNTWDWLYVTNGAITNWTLSQYLSHLKRELADCIKPCVRELHELPGQPEDKHDHHDRRHERSNRQNHSGCG